jgi:hypothetical protein
MEPRTLTRVVWRPQAGPQKALIDCPLPEVLYGGARGGGKTDGVLGKYALKSEAYGKGFNAVFFRKEMPQQDDLIERAKDIYLPLRAQWHEQKKLFEMSGGGRVRFRPLENVRDAEKYQGQNLSDATVEEAGNYETSAPIDMLFGALRSVSGVPTQLILTANPGGAGHHWLKARFIDPCPTGMRILVRRLSNGADHRYCYIPSRVSNNRLLLAQDPEYINRLHLVGSPELVKAWLEGDWNVIAGAYFPEFSIARHVVEPFEIPKEWVRFRAMDWGSAKPFSVGWYAVADGSNHLPRGCLVKYREWYGASSPNVGLKMTAEEVGSGIRQRGHEDYNYSVIDPAAYQEDGGPSIAERMFRAAEVRFAKADNKRLPGWDQLRARLKGDGEKPMIVFFPTCQHTIRTLPTLQHDQVKPEDVDTEAEDHAGDETRYACMSRPYIRDVSAKKQPWWENPSMPTLDELWKEKSTQKEKRI